MVLTVIHQIISICIIIYVANTKYTGRRKLLFISVGIIIEIFNFWNFYYIPTILLLIFILYLCFTNVKCDVEIKKDDTFLMNYYSQHDRRWAGIKYGNSSVKFSGCVPTVMAMIHSSVDRSITPAHTANWAINKSDAIRGNSTDIDFLIQYGRANDFICDYIRRDDIGRVTDMLRDGYFIPMLITSNLHKLNGLFGFARMHEIVIYDYNPDSGTVKIADPADISALGKSVKLRKIIKYAVIYRRT